MQLVSEAQEVRILLLSLSAGQTTSFTRISLSMPYPFESETSFLRDCVYI
jgi:hypothetical protein